MPVHSRITSINSFATGKTARVPIESNYVEDYFDVQTFLPKSTTVGFKLTTNVDFQDPESNGLIWVKKMDQSHNHQWITKLETSRQVTTNGLTIGIGSNYLMCNRDNALQDISGTRIAGGNGAAYDWETEPKAYTIYDEDTLSPLNTNFNDINPTISFQFKAKKKFLQSHIY